MRLLRPSSWACMPLQSVWKFACSTASTASERMAADTKTCEEDKGLMM